MESNIETDEVKQIFDGSYKLAQDMTTEEILVRVSELERTLQTIPYQIGGLLHRLSEQTGKV